MFDSPSIMVGLEVGTSKVCVVVGRADPDGSLSIIGIGQARSRGVRKGEIIDPALAEEDIRNAIVAAEQMANKEIRRVYLGVSGNHIRGFTNRGVHTVLSVDREITRDDVLDVIKNAKAINQPSGHRVIHAIRQHFLVDGQDGIVDPVGLLGRRVEVDMHVVHGNLNRLQNPVRVVEGLQLEVQTVVFNGLASALALLTHEQKELGALVIDLGAGTTNYVVCANGIIKHSGALALGEDHVSNDLAIGLKIPLHRAERLKLAHGCAVLDENVRGQTLAEPNELGLPEKPVNLEHLHRIMALRLEEILELIERELEREGLLAYLRAGVFLCGGGARIPQIQALAERVFRLRAYLGKTNSIANLSSKLDQPEFATGMGLVKFASLQRRQRGKKSSFAQGLKRTLSIFFQKSP